jgi:uridine kinase
MKKGMIISICGGSGSGKTTLAKTFIDATIISTDSFYVGKSQMTRLENGNYDFDHPDAVALDECAKATLESAKKKWSGINPYGESE